MKLYFLWVKIRSKVFINYQRLRLPHFSLKKKLYWRMKLLKQAIYIRSHFPNDFLMKNFFCNIT